ncbi:MAG: helix-turn-helix domain-containing protein [Muribaculaceae bacterium]|nr:helix-turn-helix domain-containing protein [Muribaculaceae bacterium]
MAITRKDAKMIAEELFRMMRGDVISAAKEITKLETEEYYTPKDVARILGWNQYTVYKKKDILGCYVRINNRLLFPKSKLHAAIQSGRL